MEFSNYLQKHMNSGIKQLVFAIGGSYDFSQDVYNKAQGKLSLQNDVFAPTGTFILHRTIVSWFYYFTKRTLSSSLNIAFVFNSNPL